jgi:hypothetical protein
VSKSVAKSHADPTKWSTGLGSLRLQKPDWVFFEGEVRPWEEAVLHVSTEAVVRGLNVFEGLKGYWQPDGGFGFVQLARHYVRLSRSASLLYIPVTFSYDEFESAGGHRVRRASRASVYRGRLSIERVRAKRQPICSSRRSGRDSGRCQRRQGRPRSNPAAGFVRVRRQGLDSPFLGSGGGDHRAREWRTRLVRPCARPCAERLRS